MAKVYDTTRFGQLYYASRSPQIRHLGLAADYLSCLFDEFSVPFAFIGGWAMRLRGNSRKTEEVDVAVTSTMGILEVILLSQSRIHFPVVHGQTSVQIFIDTGENFDLDQQGLDDLAVSMHVVIGGNLGTPYDLTSNRELINSIAATPRYKPVMVLDLSFQVSAKLAAFNDRIAHSHKDYVDLMFLLTLYQARISTFADSLNLDHRRLLLQTFTTFNARADEKISALKKTLCL